MKSGFIFDLDGTLLQLDGSIQKNYFKSVYSKENSLKILDYIRSCAD